MLIQPYLPVQRGDVRVSNLTVINAILFVTENGCKWRALPPRFGKWYKVYTRMHCWADAGVLDRLFNALQDHRMIRVSVDCLSWAAHPLSSTRTVLVRQKNDPQAIGKSRCG